MIWKVIKNLKETIRKTGVHHNGLGLKKIIQNLIPGIQELWIAEKSFCDGVSQKAIDQLRESKLYHDSRALTTENDTSIEVHDEIATTISSEQKIIVIITKIRWT